MKTIEGALLAYEQGATVIELDVYLTTDGEVVVMHDGTTATVTAPTESGCKSMLGSMAFLLMAGMAVVVMKKKSE